MRSAHASLQEMLHYLPLLAVAAFTALWRHLALQAQTAAKQPGPAARHCG